MPKFQWYDVMSVDKAATEKFYSAVMGWKAEPAQMGDGSYTVLSTNGVEWGGVMEMPVELQKTLNHAVWSAYILVDDLHAYVRRIVTAGGSIFREPWETEGVGSFAVAADPGGARFVLMQPQSTGELHTVPFGTVGHVGWHELMVDDPDKALSFYMEVFGWDKGFAADMGHIGIYQQFVCDGVATGGMMKFPCDGIPPHWRLYFTVDGIESTMALVTENGGTVEMGPQSVPGGMWIAQCTDPQGARFGVTSANK